MVVRRFDAAFFSFGCSSEYETTRAGSTDTILSLTDLDKYQFATGLPFPPYIRADGDRFHWLGYLS